MFNWSCSFLKLLRGLDILLHDLVQVLALDLQVVLCLWVISRKEFLDFAVELLL